MSLTTVLRPIRRSFGSTTFRAVLLAVIAVIAGAIAFSVIPSPGSRNAAGGGIGSTPPPPQAVSFIAFGDAGQGSKGQLQVRDQMRAVASTYQFALLVGDGAYPNGTVADYDAKFFPVYAGLFQGKGEVPGAPSTELPKPLFTTTGNHDYYGTPDASGYKSLFRMPLNGPPGQEDYSFDIGNVHFLALDSEYLTDPSTLAIDRAAVKSWMIADLDRHRDQVTVVFDHHPAYSAGPQADTREERAIRTTWFPIAAAHGADLFLSGHEHDYERNLPESGLTSYVSGGGGGVLSTVNPRSYTAAAVSDYGFLEVRVEGCRISTDFRRANGTAFDPWSFQAPSCTSGANFADGTSYASSENALPPGTVVFHDQFENGSLAQWNVVTAGDGTATVQRQTVGDGAASALLSESAAAGSVSYARAVLRSPETELTISLMANVLGEGQPRSNVPLLQLTGPDGRKLLELYRQNIPSGKLYVWAAGKYLPTRGQLSLGSWVHLVVHVKLSPGGSEADVHANGVGIFGQTGLDLGTSVGALQLGNNVPRQAFRLAVDDVVAEVPAP